jgi:uncharacterized protein
MSAANASAPSPSIHEEMRAHEPSMEEILASIRRIIADDDQLPGARREERRRREAERAAAEEQQTPAPQSVAYLAPAAEADAQPEAPAEPEPQLAPVAQIRSLRLNRLAPEPVVVEEPAAEDEDDAEETDLSLSEADNDASVASLEIEASVAFSEEEDGEGAPLVSSEAASSIASHFQALATSMFINESGLLQKYAQEMLRPMLKQWLDDNLPVIVERLVRAEIERVARGGRR